MNELGLIITFSVVPLPFSSPSLECASLIVGLPSLGWRSGGDGTSLVIHVTLVCCVAFLGRPELLLLSVCSMSVTTSWVSDSKTDQKQSLCSNNNYSVM